MTNQTSVYEFEVKLCGYKKSFGERILTEIKEFKKGTGTHYPYVLSGAGESIPEDYFIEDLINKINEDGSEYREYNSDTDNELLKGKMLLLKNIYEDDGESNIILN